MKKLFNKFLNIFNSQKDADNTRVVAIDKAHLEKLIQTHIKKYGLKCSLNHIDVSQITDMNSLFSHSKFNGDISEWDVSNVKNMSSMFSFSNFNGNISNWNTSNLIKMSEMFFGSKFNSDISQWNVSKVEDMHSMFSHSQFNGDISNWNVSQVKIMHRMFDFSKFNRDISKWNVSKVEDMSFMFEESDFRGDISDWKPYNLSSCSYVMHKYHINPPYWLDSDTSTTRNESIDFYHLQKKINANFDELKLELNVELINNTETTKKLKI